MKRVAPEEVLKAYEEKGLKPIQREFRKGEHCCALGALFYESAEVLKCAYDEYGLDYTTGFMSGFDVVDGFPLQRYWSGERKQGFIDGQAAWNAVKHLKEEPQ